MAFFSLVLVLYNISNLLTAVRYCRDSDEELGNRKDDVAWVASLISLTTSGKVRTKGAETLAFRNEVTWLAMDSCPEGPRYHNPVRVAPWRTHSLCGGSGSRTFQNLE